MNETYEFEVKSELYGTTTCVVYIETFLQGRNTFPCGDGDDYTLRGEDIVKINKAIKDKNPA